MAKSATKSAKPTEKGPVGSISIRTDQRLLDVSEFAKSFTPVRLRILETIRDAAVAGVPISAAAVARAIDIVPSNANGYINDMRRMGLISRSPDGATYNLKINKSGFAGFIQKVSAIAGLE